MDKHYDFKSQDENIYNMWIKSKIFDSIPSGTPYTCLSPPPNVNGSLHLGHALNCTIQDILIRYHKLKGFNTLFAPGFDHGGIGSSTTFEKELLKQNIKKQDMSRIEFTAKLYDWSMVNKNNITNQLKKLGCAFDWSRSQFTMNEHFSGAVLKTFVKMYNDNLIYRGKYVVNWCPRCATALSDDEVENQENIGKMYYLKYKFADNSGKYLIIATTRPETIFGDTAVAFHPSDERYKDLEGKEVIVPIINRKIKLIKDHTIHKDFGTGLVKITPAHCKNDFNIGRTHNLEIIQIIDGRCKIFNTNTKYDGLDRFKCREQIVKDLDDLELLEKQEPYKNKVGTCYRCATIIHDHWSDQWFIKMEPLIKLAQKVINNGEIELIPEYQTKIFNVWTGQNMDWCISRQTSWGHKIPIWYCSSCSRIMCQEKAPLTCNKCNSTKLEQDPDVLDTWFSSGLYAHGVHTNETDLSYYYPSSVLVTGKDILYFWVSKMIMMSLYMTGKIPFKKVLLHGIIRDEHGKKMSKSKANVVNPLDIIDNHGTDALRYSLMYNLSITSDLKLNKDFYLLGKTLCTKLWNAARFIFMNITETDKPNINDNMDQFSEFDKWIMVKFNKMLLKYEDYLNEYSFSNALKELSSFFWNDLANLYLEIAKNFINDINTIKILLVLLSKLLRLYHPFMPFITESIWSHLITYFPKYSASIMQSTFPENFNIIVNNYNITQYFIDTIGKIRELKTTDKYNKVLISSNEINVNFINQNKDVLSKLTKINEIETKVATDDNISLE